MRTFVLVGLLWSSLLLPSQSRADGKVDGRTVYAARCAFCHGEKGAGNGTAGASLQPPPTDFTSGAYWKGKTDDEVRRAIADGKPGTAMMGFGTTLAPGEADALLAFLKSLAPPP